jgi:hypothetical protein
MSPRAVVFLRHLENLSFFAGQARNKSLSNMAMEMVLRRMKIEAATRSRIPFQLPRLGGQRLQLPARNNRDGIGPRHRGQGRTSVPPQRRAREAPQANGYVGNLLRAASSAKRCSDSPSSEISLGFPTLSPCSSFANPRLARTRFCNLSLVSGSTGPAAIRRACSRPPLQFLPVATVGQSLTIGGFAL